MEYQIEEEKGSHPTPITWIQGGTRNFPKGAKLVLVKCNMGYLYAPPNF